MAITIDPKNANSYNKRGEAKRALNNHQSALEDFTTAIGINPKHAIAYRNLGNIKFTLFRLDHGFSDWEIASNLGDKESTQLLERYCLEKF